MISLSSPQMRSVDNEAIKIGLTVEKMMENAGRAVALVAKRMKGKNYLILVGKGNNGGDGLVAARHLKNWGFNVSILLAEDKMSEINKDQLRILKFANVPVYKGKSKSLFDKPDVIIDSLIGYSLKGNPRENYASLINMANESGKKILSVDSPTGFDVDIGEPYDPCIRAHATITLALPKKGLVKRTSKKYVGRLFVGDIGIPQGVYKKLNIKTGNVFSKSEIVRV